MAESQTNAAPSIEHQLTFRETLQRITTHLDSDDIVAQETACTTLCVLLSNAPPEEDLGWVAAQLIQILSTTSNLELQKHTAAALSAAMETCESAAMQAVDANVAHKVVQLLNSRPGSSGLVFNLCVMLSVLGASGDRAARSVLEAGGVEALLALCDAAQEEGLQEVAVDGLCRLAAHNGDAKAAAVGAGAIPRLAGMLASQHGEVRVRVLLGLGMLLGEDVARQRQLAEAPGAAAQLLTLMRQGDDLDSQHIAGELFRGLAANTELREPLAVAMRAAQQEANQPAKFV